MNPLTLFVLVLLALACTASADPQLTSWFTGLSSKYARLFESVATETAGTSVTTWSRGAGAQSTPAYAGVSDVSYSASWVYIRTSGLAGHVMGPWYLDAAKTQNFGNFPSNTKVIYRIPRTPTPAATKTLTPGGAIGYFVNGVAFFDNRDTFSYSNTNAKDADPTAGIGSGDGIWTRDALPNEGATFDAALAHQAGNNYHYHVQPVALRAQLGDHVIYNEGTNRYTESTAAVTAHSPIIAWAADGYPVYGPYGYSVANDATSGLRRVVSGFVLRNGVVAGTTNLTNTGRHTLPAWAASWQNRSATLTATQYGPNVAAAYALGHYLEDYDYLGDLGFTQGATNNAGGIFYDLDRYNGRTCVTPEFPNGTYAYFSTIAADGTPLFPYNIGRQFYGSPTGGVVTSITEAVTTTFTGGPALSETMAPPVKTAATGNLALTWSSVEGGTYLVQRTPDLSTWSSLGTVSAAANAVQTSLTDAGTLNANARRFYRSTRPALASYDGNGGTAMPPTVGTGAATTISTTNATLNGTVNASGVSTVVTFEYGLTTAYGSTANATPSPATGTTAGTAAVTLTGLTAATTYHFRIKGVSSAGTRMGVDATFTTAVPGGPDASTAAATSLTNTTAALNGLVNANGNSTTVTFSYGLTTSYGTMVNATPNTVTGSTSTNVSAALTSLTLGTTYHFKITAVNGVSTTSSADATFTTTGGSNATVAPGGSATRGTTVSVTITLPTTPPPPPLVNPAGGGTLLPSSVTLATSITGTSVTRPAQGTVIATFSIPAGTATGAQNIVVIFPGAGGAGPTYTVTLTIN